MAAGSAFAQGDAASPRPSGPCFDFSKPVRKPLRVEIARGKQGEDVTDSGSLASGAVWGAARGIVKKPLKAVLASLLDPYTIKGPPDSAHLRIVEEKRPGFHAFKRITVEIRPFPFIHIEWDEEWAFVVTEGTEQEPLEVVFSYQKVAGTDHLKRLCGSIVLRPDGALGTDASFYEEVEASRRSREDTLKGHLGTLDTLRYPERHGR